MALGAKSKAWRDKLMEQVKVPVLSQSFDIHKYYDLAAKVLEQAEGFDADNNYSHAYIKYKLFHGVAKEIIFKHNYYKHYKKQRTEFNVKYELAVDRLEGLVKRMDEEVAKNEAKVKAQETERLRLLAEQEARERAEVLRQQERAAAAAAARLQAEAAARKAEQDAASALSKKQKEQEKRNIENMEKERKAEINDGHNKDTNLLGYDFDDSINVKKKSSKTAIYTFEDGKEEEVEIIKAHSQQEGGGYTIFIPSLNRERSTEESRLRFHDVSAATPSATATLSADDFDFLSNGSATQSSTIQSNEKYPSVPNPSWMPESTGEAHRVVLPSPKPPALPAFQSPASSTSTSTISSLEEEQGDEDLLTDLPKRSTPQAIPPSAPPPAYSIAPSAPPAYDMAYDSYPSDEVIQAVVVDEVTQNKPTTNHDAIDTSSSAHSHYTPPAAPPMRAPTVTPPKVSPSPPNPPPAPKVYDEDGEENLADMLAAAATAASRPIVSTPVPSSSVSSDNFGNNSHVDSTASGSNHDYDFSYEKSSKRSLLTANELKYETDRQWQALLRRGRSRIDYLATYQGVKRNGGDSTNGCTVIAPLIGFRHIKWTNPRLPNSHIEHVIDNDCPPILGAIRRKFSLPNGSFVVPADVHDYLFDQKLLEESYFGGVHGGNVMDEEHMGSMIETLEGFKHKAAVCFFFKEHVVAILKDQLGKYELVDSLPDATAGVGIRIHCEDSSVLRICLAWYCMKKFSARDIDYIDSTPWDDLTAEVDPRIFQGHIWTSGQ